MLTALVGALVGGLINVAAYVIAQKIRGKQINWGIVAANFAGGAVSGALAGSTFGLSWLGAGGLRTFGWLAGTSAAGSGAQQIVENIALDRAPLAGVPLNMAEAAGEGVLLYGGARVLVKALPELKPVLGQDAAQEASRLRRVAHRVRSARSAHAAVAIALGNATQGWFGSLAGGVAGNLAPWFEEKGCKVAEHTPVKSAGLVERLCGR